MLKTASEKGWKYIAKEVLSEIENMKKVGVALKKGESLEGNATRSVLKKLLPEYAKAYKYAPISHWADYGLSLLRLHLVFTALGLVLNPIMQKQEEEQQKKLEHSDEFVNSFVGAVNFGSDEAQLLDAFEDGAMSEEQ